MVLDYEFLYWWSDFERFSDSQIDKDKQEKLTTAMVFGIFLMFYYFPKKKNNFSESHLFIKIWKDP